MARQIARAPRARRAPHPPRGGTRARAATPTPTPTPRRRARINTPGARRRQTNRDILALGFRP
jgi:hypothetical protein